MKASSGTARHLPSLLLAGVLVLGVACEGDQPCPPPHGYCVSEAAFSVGVLGGYELRVDGEAFSTGLVRCPGAAGDGFDGANLWVWSCHPRGLAMRDDLAGLPDGPFDLTLTVKHDDVTKTGTARFPAAAKRFDACGNCYPRTARVELR